MLATTDSGSIPSSNDSQLYKSINRLFSSTYVRDPRFPSPPRHHSPDALPQIRIPPLRPYVRPAILNPYDDITSAKHHSAHLINPMCSFISDLHLALEKLSDPTPPPGEREAYGFQHSTPEFENQRDLSGLYRPRYTNVPSGSYASSPQEQQEKDDEEGETGAEALEELEEQVQANKSEEITTDTTNTSNTTTTNTSDSSGANGGGGGGATGSSGESKSDGLDLGE